MRLNLRFGRRSFLLLLAGLLTGGLYTSGAQEIAARAASVRGGMRLERMLLLLQPTARQKDELDALLAAQVTVGDARFHKWLTPTEFAQSFAPSTADAAAVAAWLKEQGFAVAPLPASRGWVEFSGTAAQVQKAFLTSVQVVAGAGLGAPRYTISGEAHFPAAISSSVRGLVSLDGVQAESVATAPVEKAGGVTALAAESVSGPETGSSSGLVLTPKLAEPWLHLVQSQATGVTGAGETIAIPSRSNVRAEDVVAFRRSFGLESAADGSLGVDLSGALNGVDPGRGADEAATVLAASWAGVAAPGARILLVPAASTNATDGLDLALAAAVDGALAHTISVGYSACESGTSEGHRAFYAALYRQAAVEGISVVVATGDSGAAACHAAGDAAPVSTGLDVNALASTPWNTAVGAAAFTADGKGLAGWGQASAADAALATGGGASRAYPAPQWQSAVGLTVDDATGNSDGMAGHFRALPDVSLPTAVDARVGQGLAFCFAGDAAQSGCRLVTSGGSAASAAIFAGLSALLAEKYGPQGNLAPNLYALRRGDSARPRTVFSDITSGDAKLRCVAGSVSCSESGEIGFSAAVGYDLATGLGSVDAEELVKEWLTPQATGTTAATVEMTNVGGLTYNPSANITLSAKVLSGSGGTTPTGTVQFVDQTSGGNTGTAITLASDGTASYTENAQFSVGGHNIAALYSGDSTYAAGESQPVTINIQPSATTLVVSPSTTTPAAGTSVTVTGTVTSATLGSAPPTGSLTVNLDGLSQGTQRFTTTAGVTTATVTVTAPSGGSHAIQGIYSGDINYNNSTSPTVTIAVAKSATVTTIAATPSVLATGVPETFTATVAPTVSATGTVYVITGTVSFYDQGTTLLGTALISSNTAILTGVSLSNTVSHTVTAVYSGDASYTSSVSSPLLLSATLLPVTVKLTESSGVLAPNQPVTLTATITPVNFPPLTAEQNPSGYVLFFAGTTQISAQVPVAQGPGDTGVASTFVPHLSAGIYVITAQYYGDPTYGPAVSNSVGLQVEDFTIGCNVFNISMAQGTTQSVTCNVASLGGLTGPIQVACSEQNPPQLGAIQCVASPSVVSGTGTTTVTIITKAGNISRNERPVLWPAAGGGAALACLGALLWPVGRRGRVLRGLRNSKMLVLALLLAGMAGAGLGCSNSVTLNNTGTPLGTATIQITAAAYVNTVTVSHNAYLTVDVTP